jgi:hypothetical protein
LVLNLIEKDKKTAPFWDINYFVGGVFGRGLRAGLAGGACGPRTTAFCGWEFVIREILCLGVSGSTSSGYGDPRKMIGLWIGGGLKIYEYKFEKLRLFHQKGMQ